MFDHMTNLDWVQLGFMLGLLMLLIHTDNKYRDEQDKVHSRDTAILVAGDLIAELQQQVSDLKQEQHLLEPQAGPQDTAWCLTCMRLRPVLHFEQTRGHMSLGADHGSP